MISPLPLLLALGLLALPLARAESDVAAARQADDARVAAFTSGDAAKLAAIFSDDLTYVHSTGKVNHKADFIATLSSGALRYLSIDYEAREFQAVAPGVVLVRGRCLVHSHSDKEEHNHLSFLMVFRREGDGVWRFLAWQSCKLSADSPPWPVKG
jgi:uncharacterized protein (TIGR02246 family)